MLRIENLSAWYGEAQVLREAALEVAEGEIVTLVGRNGAGKTTLLRCLLGLHKQCQGTITFLDQDLTRMAAHRRARRGLCFVPYDRGIFASLSVEENLRLPPTIGPEPWSLAKVY